MNSYFDESELERVREATDLVELVGGYVTLKRKGQNDLWGRCPFHSEKTSSFHVRPERGMYHCFGCGKGGNAFTFIMEMERLSFGEAVRMLAERAGIQLKTTVSNEIRNESGQERERIFHACAFAENWFHQRLVAPKRSKAASSALEYLEARGINIELIKRLRIGFAEPGWEELVSEAHRSGVSAEVLVSGGLALKKKSGHGYVDRFRARVIFPIVSLAGKAIAFGGRRIDGITPDDDAAKYVNSPETLIYHKGEHLYGLAVARDEIRRSGTAYLVEGYIDLLAMVQGGIFNVVASLGTALTEDQAKLLSRFAGRTVIVYDGDGAGKTAAIRAADQLTLAGIEVKMAMLPSGEDPDSLLRKQGREALIASIGREQSFVQFRLEVAGTGVKMGQRELLTAARGVLETLRMVRDPLQKDLLLNELTTLTGLRRDILDREVKGPRPTNENIVSSQEKFSVIPDQIPERDLLRALLSNPILIPEAMQLVEVTSFENVGLRKIFLALEQDFIASKRISPEALIDKIDDPLLRTFVTEATIGSDDHTLEAAREDMEGCASLLQKRKLQREKGEIEKKLRLPSASSEERRELLSKFVELNKQIQAYNIK